MASSDSRSLTRCGDGHLACKFPINVTVPRARWAMLLKEYVFDPFNFFPAFSSVLIRLG